MSRKIDCYNCYCRFVDGSSFSRSGRANYLRKIEAYSRSVSGAGTAHLVRLIGADQHPRGCNLSDVSHEFNIGTEHRAVWAFADLILGARPTGGALFVDVG
jgi:hypothetical protein